MPQPILKKPKKMKCLLSVNINKIATLRNSRGGDNPNVVSCAERIIGFGAAGITVHPRPDERHIRKTDVFDLQRLLKKTNRARKHPIEFNIEGYPSRDYLALIKAIRPDQATLVPDPPQAITSNAGWKMAAHEQKLTRIVRQIQGWGVRVSLFVDPAIWSEKERMALSRIAPDRIELYTEAYAVAAHRGRGAKALPPYQRVAREAFALGIRVNAGHDLDSENLPRLLRQVPEIEEVSIGHALISDALFWGLKKTIGNYKQAIAKAR